MRTQSTQTKRSDVNDLDICTSAPASAEHARLNNDGPEPCDDGRGIEFETDSK
ncbi:MAG: hypothetical protein MI799_19365 [Desulfobacterales bacterium]|nr:hypothetical protein [Desulfobacterales bacterium]